MKKEKKSSEGEAFCTVGEAAQRLGISAHTIRFYGKEGLMDFVARDKNGNRMFRQSDFERMFIIASLKRSGMTIRQIREFSELCDEGDSTISERLAMLKSQREEVQDRITELQDALDVLTYKCWLYETAQAAGTTAVHDTMPLSAMPPRIRKIKERIRLLTQDMERRYKGTKATRRV